MKFPELAIDESFILLCPKGQYRNEEVGTVKRHQRELTPEHRRGSPYGTKVFCRELKS